MILLKLNTERRDSKLYTEKFQCAPEVKVIFTKYLIYKNRPLGAPEMGRREPNPPPSQIFILPLLYRIINI